MAKRKYNLAKPKSGEWQENGAFMTRKAHTRLADSGDVKKDFAIFTAYKPVISGKEMKTTLKDVSALLGGEKNVVKLALKGFNNLAQFNLRQGDKQRAKIADKASEAFGVSVTADEMAAALEIIRKQRAKS